MIKLNIIYYDDFWKLSQVLAYLLMCSHLINSREADGFSIKALQLYTISVFLQHLGNNQFWLAKYVQGAILSAILISALIVNLTYNRYHYRIDNNYRIGYKKFWIMFFLLVAYLFSRPGRFCHTIGVLLECLAVVSQHAYVASENRTFQVIADFAFFNAIYMFQSTLRCFYTFNILVFARLYQFMMYMNILKVWVDIEHFRRVSDDVLHEMLRP